jgi:hypothetical protein
MMLALMIFEFFKRETAIFTVESVVWDILSFNGYLSFDLIRFCERFIALT